MIYQILNSFRFGDAISDHALFIQDFLKTKQINSEIINLSSFKYRNGFYKFKKKDTIIIHFSFKLSEHWNKFKHTKNILIYHNVSPHFYFSPFLDSFAKDLETARLELIDNKKYIFIWFSDSEFNAEDLKKLEIQSEVLPIPIQEKKWNPINSVKPRNPFQLLFVGRFVPNKKQEDLLRVLFILKQINTNYKLVLVGYSDIPEYFNYLKNLINLLKLKDSVKIYSGLNDHEISELYQESGLFLSMSEHEGFSVPMIEAMKFELPIVAYSAGAIPETVGLGGFLLKEKNSFIALAEKINDIVNDSVLKENLVKEAKKQLEKFKPEQLKPAYLKLVDYLN